MEGERNFSGYRGLRKKKQQNKQRIIRNKKLFFSYFQYFFGYFKKNFNLRELSEECMDDSFDINLYRFVQ